MTLHLALIPHTNYALQSLSLWLGLCRPKLDMSKSERSLQLPVLDELLPAQPLDVSIFDDDIFNNTNLAGS